MIQDIYPHQFSNNFEENAQITDNDYVFHFKEKSLLLKKKGEKFDFPKSHEIENIKQDPIFLFTFNEVKCFLVTDNIVPNNENLDYYEIKSSLTINQKEIDYVCVVAFQLYNWYSRNKYCGTCGTKNEIKNNERALKCPKCKSIKYPNISPAIIVAITCNDKILLASGANFREGYYSLVAGYIDFGETIEDAVAREVKEEIGIDIKNVRYYKSQPWPYSSSLMIGFTAEADDSQPIRIDEKEIREAGWFTRDNLPEYPAERSIAGELINKFVNKEN